MTKRVAYLLILLIFTLAGKVGIAQSDTTLLSEVSVVKDRSSQFAVGSEILSLDSSRLRSYEGQNLTGVLQNESGIFLKYYSPGNLATTSFRGASAQQTALTWNGFNINSPLNGLFDLSLFPVDAFDEVEVQAGASSALWGSGAIGGSIHLGHQPDFKKHLRLNIDSRAGSFGYLYESASLDFGSPKYSNRILVLNQFAENDFSYTNPYTREKETQQNNEIHTRALLSENYFRPGKNNLISLDLWLQKTDRNIPPSFFEITRSNQKDKVSRLTSEWVHQYSSSNLKIRGAWFSENEDFDNLTGDTSYYNNNNTFIGESEYDISLNPAHRLDIGFNNTSVRADVQSYKKPALWQHRQSLFVGYQWKIIPKLKFSAMLRQEMVDLKFVPFTYTLGMNWQAGKQFTIKGQFSKVYRTPTLNDIYWVPGGNPSLESEQGYAEELSAIWARQTKILKWRVAVSGYNRKIENWILWQPESGIWTPKNLLEVRSRGLENHSSLAWQNGPINIRLDLNLNYCIATNEKAANPNDASVGKQLTYTPRFNGTGGLTIHYAKFSLRYTHSYTGYTYTTSDHSEFLDPYQLGSIYIAYDPQWKKMSGHLFFRVNNIWGERYQIVRSRPMPGTNFNVGISLNFKLHPSK